MYYIGIDIGSSGVKGLVLNESGIMTTHRHETLASGSKTAEEVMNVLIRQAGIHRDEVLLCVTGIGGDRVRSPPQQSRRRIH